MKIICLIGNPVYSWKTTTAKVLIGVASDLLIYLLAKQHMRPVLPRNQRNPMKRTRDSTAVAYRRNLKKLAVRLEADPYSSSC